MVFTVEYSARGAKHAVYELLGVRRQIPPIYRAPTDQKAAFRSFPAAVR